MAADDKLRLKIARKRIDAWNEYRLNPAENKPRKGTLILAPGQEKPEVVYHDKDTIVSNLRLSIGSAEKDMRLDSGPRNACDGQGYEYNHPGNVPAHLKGVPTTAKPRKNSVFKKERRVPVIIRA